MTDGSPASGPDPAGGRGTMSSPMTEERRRARWRQIAHEVIFESDTRAGRAFDVALFIAIVASVLVVTLESVQSIRRDHALLLRTLEWVFTAAFTIEYALRLASVYRPLRYATSFFGLVDLVSIVPSYASLLLPGAQAILISARCACSACSACSSSVTTWTRRTASRSPPPPSSGRW